MEFVATGWCTGKQLRLRNPACIDWNGSKRIKARLKKTGFVYLLDLFGGRGRKSGVLWGV